MRRDQGALDTPRRGRDLALDLLRGYFLVVIIIDHLRFRVNPLYAISGNQSLWVTAAEGFVLISGFLVGMLRGDEARRDGIRPAAIHLWRRAGVLALWSALLTTGLRAVSEATGYWPEVPNADAPGGLIEYALGAIVQRRTYGDHNLLAAYALFLAASPLAIAAMLRGYTHVVVLVSGAVWGVAYVLRVAWSNSVQADLCWQLLFVIGVVLGFHRAALVAWWRARGPATRRAIAIAAALASTAILVGSVLRLSVTHGHPTHIEALLFDRDRLGPGRLVCALVLVGTLYAAVRWFEDRLVPTVGKLLVPLGQASLYVYIVQSVASFALVDRTLTNPWMAAAVSVALVGAVWIMVSARVLFGIIPR